MDWFGGLDLALKYAYVRAQNSGGDPKANLVQNRLRICTKPHIGCRTDQGHGRSSKV
jgi:hypothetical protein